MNFLEMADVECRLSVIDKLKTLAIAKLTRQSILQHEYHPKRFSY